MSWYIVESPGLKPDWFFDSKLSEVMVDVIENDFLQQFPADRQ